MNKYAVDLEIPFKFPLKTQEQFDSIPRPTLGIKKTWQKSDLDISELNVHLVSWLDSIGLFIPSWDIFIQPPQWEMHIHVDQHNSIDNATKLNYAWCDSSEYNKMCWYKAGEQTSTVKRNAGGLYRSWEKHSVEIDYEHTVKTPSLVNAGKPHNVINKTDVPRICVSIPLIRKEDLQFCTEENPKYLQWDDAIKIFGEYIKQ